MTAVADFERNIASQRFGSFKQLQDNLTAFSDFSYYHEGTQNRERFVYKYLDLKCAYAKKRNCTAYCNVRCRRNFMYIRCWSMEHNHPPDPPDTSTLVDCTESFKCTFTSMIFDSFQELEAKIRELEQMTGTRFTKYSTRMLPESSEHKTRLVYERVNYGCIHSGKTKQRNSAYIGVRSQKIGCQARIRACIAKDKLKVMLYSMKHNHIVSNSYRSSGSMQKPFFYDDLSSSPGHAYGKVDGEDAEVDFELDLPNLAATAANGFRDEDLPAMPIVLKKTRSSHSRTSDGKTKRTRRSRSYGDEERNKCDAFPEADTLPFYESPTNYLRMRDPKLQTNGCYVDQIKTEDFYACGSGGMEERWRRMELMIAPAKATTTSKNVKVVLSRLTYMDLFLDELSKGGFMGAHCFRAAQTRYCYTLASAGLFDLSTIMRKSSRPDRTILYRFSYPVYQLKVIGPNTLLAAGGGGNSKTGVPNRIDVIHFDRPACAPISQDANEALIPANTTLIGGLNTKHEAIMHMTLGCQSPGAASILALEGSTCQEYFLHANDLEPSTIADEVLTEQESAISSTGVARYFQHQHTPSSASSSSEDNHSNTGVSSTTMARRFSARTTLFEASQVAKKTPADSSGEEQLPWTCEALRSVSVAPTKALMERRRLDSCSSTGSVSALLDDGDELTCITSGGPAGGGWCAVGTVHGGVALIDRYALVEETRYSLSPRSPSNASYAFTFDNNEEDVIFPLQPFCTLPDASGGRCAPVCDVALSAANFVTITTTASKGSGRAHHSVTPLLATISGRPMGSLLCIWRLPFFPDPATAKRVKFAMDAEGGREADWAVTSSPLLYAEVKMENACISMGQKKPGQSRSKRSENGTRFRHCEFLRWTHRRPTEEGGLFTFLATTEQPVSPTTRSVCHLSVWLVPLPISAPFTSVAISGPQPVLGLQRFAAVPLPPGEIPACIAVHPSSHRGLIALGTMEGSVDAFMISLRDRSLVRVYSMPKAHPIFVTSLTFLPPRDQQHNAASGTNNTEQHRQLPLHYELVSSSADRVIRWHRGPSLQHIALTAARRSSCSTVAASFLFLLVMALPLLLPSLHALLETLSILL
uniref:Prolactin regulatory element binding protein n=1 Tax=Echinococcus granulosus TaxID=6210 RepID=A0A068WLV1_ECHGR|nr:prolactin regulatory element binding protein [Echinococcus granulosus]